MFLREKRYADFRKDYDQALSDTLDAIAGVTSDTQGRIERPEYHTDWGIDWGTIADGRFALRFMFVDHSERFPFCVVSEVQFSCDEGLTRRMLDYHRRDAAWFVDLVLLTAFVDGVLKDGVGEFVLEDANQKHAKFNFSDRRSGVVFEVVVSSRRLGVDTGLNTLTDWGLHVRNMFDDLTKKLRESERRLLREVFEEGRWPDPAQL